MSLSEDKIAERDLRKLHPIARKLHELQLKEDATMVDSVLDINQIKQWIALSVEHKEESGNRMWVLKEDTPTIRAINRTTEAIQSLISILTETTLVVGEPVAETRTTTVAATVATDSAVEPVVKPKKKPDSRPRRPRGSIVRRS